MISEDDVRAVRKGLRKKDKKERRVYLSTGSTLLNLACSGDWKGGLAQGYYYFLVGDSASGKTFWILTMMAEAAISKEFKNHRLIYDDVEGGALMSISKYFGSSLESRIEPPRRENNDPCYSETIEDFYFNLDDALDDGPCVYVLDSMDGLSSAYEMSKFDEKKSASRKGTKAKGDYGDGKAKINSSGLRSCMARLKSTGSILIIVSQTRDNIGGGLFEPAKTRSGGHALTFYATLELWTSQKGKIHKTIEGKKRQIGVMSRVRVKKNRQTGRERTVDVPIYHSYGLDDLGSCIDYLIDEGRWKKNKQGFIDTQGDLDCDSKRMDPLIRYVEDNGLEEDVRIAANATWKSIESAMSLDRKQRY